MRIIELTDGSEWACNGEGEGVFSRRSDGSWQQHAGTSQTPRFTTAQKFSRHIHATYRTGEGGMLPRMQASRGWE